MDRGAWPAAVHGVAKSQTQLSDWTRTQKNRDSVFPGYYLSVHHPFLSGETLHHLKWVSQLPSACSHYILIKTSYSSIPSRMEGRTASYSHIIFSVSNLGKFTWVGCAIISKRKRRQKNQVDSVSSATGQGWSMNRGQTCDRGWCNGYRQWRVFRGQCDQSGFCCKCGTLLESLASVSINFIVRVKAWLCVQIVLALHLSAGLRQTPQTSLGQFFICKLGIIIAWNYHNDFHRVIFTVSGTE